MIFVALDLETTGLNPEKDTIIEIAAIRFELEKKDGKFFIINSEERTMLIDPDRELKEEVTMITGITKEMLKGREKWESVKERVREFIGDSIIVGHNVLFDIAMLSSHGIDISGNITLDTFELSEIFSQEAESLNLLFLAKKYGINIEGEHRALDDTRLSVGLFIHYLYKMTEMDIQQRQIFSYFIERDGNNIISTLFQITGIKIDYSYIFIHDSHIHIGENTNHTFHTQESKKPEVWSLHGNKEEEIGLIRDAIRESESNTLLLVTNNKKQTQSWKEILQEMNMQSSAIIDANRFFSPRSVKAFIEKTNLERKEIIFSLKMLIWIESTETGLLEELKYYGNEYSYVEFLRSEENEYSTFRIKHEKNIENSQVLIGDISMKRIQVGTIGNENMSVIFRDIGCMEDTLRKSESKKVSFRTIYDSAFSLQELGYISCEFHEGILIAVSYIQNCIEHIHPRPTGPSPIAPGEYGETYFFTQEMLWHRGEKWLTLYMQSLRKAIKEKGASTKEGLLERKMYHKLIDSLEILINISLTRNESSGIILSVMENDTTLSIIPRNVSDDLRQITKSHKGERVILTGYGIGGPILRDFLLNECGVRITEDGEENLQKKLQVQGNYIEILTRSSTTVILSTSNKHLRGLSQEIQKKFPDKKVFTQGISGGKGKILSLYEEFKGEKVLLGLIDSWKDENALWKNIDTLIIAKMPFDPPTDPYYLARTIGMSNNFEKYSCPIAINTINTLIGKVHVSNPNIHLFCLDERLVDTIWGKKLYNEIL